MLNIVKTMLLSTDHLSAQSRRWLEDVAKTPAEMDAPTEIIGRLYDEDGWLLSCEFEVENVHLWPNEILNCLRYARRHQCKLVRFTPEAEVNHDLPLASDQVSEARIALSKAEAAELRKTGRLIAQILARAGM